MQTPQLNQVALPTAASLDKTLPRSDAVLAQPPIAAQTTAAVEPVAPAPSPKEVQQALQTINSSMRSLSRNLEFSVDPDSERIIVRIVDQQTNEIIRQMPTREALDIAKAIDKAQGLLLSERA